MTDSRPVFSTYPDELGVSFIAAVLAFTCLSLAFLWLYASRKRLIEQGLTSGVVGIQAVRLPATAVVVPPPDTPGVTRIIYAFASLS